jgi:hypothetical protein
MKGPILDWIVPLGSSLNPPIARNNKSERGFNHEQIGVLLCPIDYDWSNAEYVSYFFEFVHAHGILAESRHSYGHQNFLSAETTGPSSCTRTMYSILMTPGMAYSGVSFWSRCAHSILAFSILTFCIQAFKHIFTSPSSVDKEPKATRSGNARIHGMSSITLASLAYVATQVCCK